MEYLHRCSVPGEVRGGVGYSETAQYLDGVSPSVFRSRGGAGGGGVWGRGTLTFACYRSSAATLTSNPSKRPTNFGIPPKIPANFIIPKQIPGL